MSGTVNVGDVEAVIRLIDRFSPVLIQMQGNIVSFGVKTIDEAKKVNTAFLKMVDSFSGDKIARESAIAIAAMNKIGGFTSLTEAEQTKLAKTVMLATDKYRAMGMEVPKELQVIDAAARKIIETHKQQIIYQNQVKEATKAYEREAIAAYNRVAASQKVAAAYAHDATMEYNRSVSIATRAYEREAIAAHKAAAEAAAAPSKALADHINKLKESATMWRTLGRDMVQVGASMAMYVSAPIVAGFVGAAKAASDFETNLVRLVTVSAVSEETMVKMRQAVLDLAPAVGIGPVKLSEALLQVTSTGIRGMEAMKVLEYAAKGSAIGLGDVTEVAKTITAAMAAYEKQGMTAAKATNILYGMVVEGKGELDQFAGALGRVVGIASTVGVSMEDVAAFIATFTRTGGSAAEAVTALRGVLQRLEIKETKNTRDAFKAMGADFDTFRDGITGGVGLVNSLIKLQNEFGATNAQLGLIFPNVRAMNGHMTVAGAQADNAAKIFANLKNETYQMSDAFARTEKTIGQQWKVLMASLQSAVIDLGEKLRPAIEKLIPFFQGLIDKFVSLVDWFGKLDPWQQSFVEWLVLIGTVSGPALFTLGQVARGIGLIVDAWILLAKAQVAAKLSGMVTGVQDLAMALLGGTGLKAAIAATMSTAGQLGVILAGLGVTLYALGLAWDVYAQKEKLAQDNLTQEQKDYEAIAWVFDNLKIRVYSAAEAYRLMNEHAQKLRNQFYATQPFVESVAKGLDDTGKGGKAAGVGVGEATEAVKEFNEQILLVDKLGAPKIERMGSTFIAVAENIKGSVKGAIAPFLGWADSINLTSNALGSATERVKTATAEYQKFLGTLSGLGVLAPNITSNIRDFGEQTDKTTKITHEARDAYRLFIAAIGDMSKGLKDAGLTTLASLTDGWGRAMQAISSGASKGKAALIGLGVALQELGTTAKSTGHELLTIFGSGAQGGATGGPWGAFIGTITGMLAAFKSGAYSAGLAFQAAFDAKQAEIAAAAADKLLSILEKFGLVSGGGAGSVEELAAAAKLLQEEWQLMIQSGLNHEQALSGMGQSIRDLAKQYTLLGIEVPESLQEIIHILDEYERVSGNLLIGNGKAIAEFIKQFDTIEDLETAVDVAEEAYRRMVESGLYSAEVLAEAWQAWQDALIKAGDEAARAADKLAKGMAKYQTREQLKQAAADAKAVWEAMVKSGLYTAGTLKDAWQAWQDALINAGDAGATAIKKIDDELKKLNDSIADEAPEEVMGVVEAEARRRIAQLEEERRRMLQGDPDGLGLIDDQMTETEKTIVKTADLAQQAIDKSLTQAKDAAIEIGRQIDTFLEEREWVIKVIADVQVPSGGGGSGTSGSSPYYAPPTGLSGLLGASYTPSSVIAPSQAGGAQTYHIHVNADGRELTDLVVRHMNGRLSLLGAK